MKRVKNACFNMFCARSTHYVSVRHVLHALDMLRTRSTHLTYSTHFNFGMRLSLDCHEQTHLQQVHDNLISKIGKLKIGLICSLSVCFIWLTTGGQGGAFIGARYE